MNYLINESHKYNPPKLGVLPCATMWYKVAVCHDVVKNGSVPRCGTKWQFATMWYKMAVFHDVVQNGSLPQSESEATKRLLLWLLGPGQLECADTTGNTAATCYVVCSM